MHEYERYPQLAADTIGVFPVAEQVILEPEITISPVLKNRRDFRDHAEEVGMHVNVGSSAHTALYRRWAELKHTDSFDDDPTFTVRFTGQPGDIEGAFIYVSTLKEYLDTISKQIDAVQFVTKMPYEAAANEVLSDLTVANFGIRKYVFCIKFTNKFFPE